MRTIVLGLIIFFQLAAWQGLARNSKEIESIDVAVSIPVWTSLGHQGIQTTEDTWLSMINKARKTIDIAQFYLATDKSSPLESIIEAIRQAAKRGVKVRFLVSRPVNDDMRRNTNEVLDRFKNSPNVKTSTFQLEGGGINHAKYFIVDREQVFIGSQNFDWRALTHIHETGLRIRSRVFGKGLTRIFNADWKFSSGDKDAYKKLQRQKAVVFPSSDYIVASPGNCNPPGIKEALPQLIRLIDSAKTKITIQLLDYSENIPSYLRKKDPKLPERFSPISDALLRAAGRGVKVQMMVANWIARKEAQIETLKRLTKVTNFEIKIVSIPQKKDQFIKYARVHHSKVMRIDDNVSWVGTSNWGYRYFYNSRNVEVVTHSTNVAKPLDRLFTQLWNSKYVELVVPFKTYNAPRIK